MGLPKGDPAIWEIKEMPHWAFNSAEACTVIGEADHKGSVEPRRLEVRPHLGT
jgi:hypothetical protein